MKEDIQKIEPINLLLVDDRPENLLVLENILQDLECQFFKTTSGYDALRLVMRHDFALVLLDVQMPDLDGFEVGPMELRPSQFPLRSFINTLVKNFRIQAEQKQLQFIYTAASDLPIAVEGDKI